MLKGCPRQSEQARQPRKGSTLTSELLAKALRGGVSGAIATVPMTVVMEQLFQKLPLEQRYPLPPRQITSRLGKQLSHWDEFSERQKLLITLIAHFAYGSAMGGCFNLFFPHQQRSFTTGAAFGFGIWAGSYVILLPSLNLLRPATDHPMERTLLMVLAHLIWGGSLAEALKLVDGQTKEECNGRSGEGSDSN